MVAQEFIGKRLFQKYEDIYPVVRLVLYRCDPDGEGALFPHDGDWSKTASVKHRLLNAARCVLYPMRKIFSSSPRRDTIFLSDTMLRIDRYRGLLAELYANCDVVASGAVSNIINRPIPGMGELNWKIFCSRKLFFGESVSGWTVKSAARELRNLFVELIEENRVCDDEFERVDRCLGMLRTAVNQRIDELGLVLKKARVKCFVTINAYNLRDVLTVMACRKAGIWTKELSHHMWCLISLDFFREESLAYWFLRDHGKAFLPVNESCQWSGPEKIFCEKYGVFDPLYSDLQISVVGCPEVTRAEFEKNTAQYPKEDAIVIFVPAIARLGEGGILPGGGVEQLQKIMCKNFELFRKTALLAEKYHMKVYVRHYPPEQKYIPEEEKELLKALGFELLSASREDFLKAVCASKVAIGHMTSALTYALIYGCRCYNLVIGGKDQRFDYCGLNIHDIKIDQIPDLSLDISEEAVPVNCINYIDVERLCSYPDLSERKRTM